MVRDQYTTKGGAKVRDLEVVLEERRLDADALLAAGRDVSSIAMAIYAVEICLKIAICRKLDVEHLPRPFEIHDLEGLKLLSGLSRMMAKDQKISKSWGVLEANMGLLNQLRYEPQFEIDHQQAEKFHFHVFDKDQGVVPWLKRHMPTDI